MKRTIIFISLSFFLVTSLLFASCSSTSATTTTTLTTTTAASATTTSTTTATTPPGPHPTTSPTPVVVTTTSTGNWWDSLGTPQYGGVINDHLTQNITTWDVYLASNGQQGFAPYLEALFGAKIIQPTHLFGIFQVVGYLVFAICGWRTSAKVTQCQIPIRLFVL